MLRLHKYWSAFCDADPVDSPEVPDEMEAAGLIELVPVDEDALEDPFAAERGILPGGQMWQLTDAGHEAMASEPLGKIISLIEGPHP